MVQDGTVERINIKKGGDMMENEELLMLEETVSFKADDFDEKGNIKASSLMYAFQEIASDHAESLGYGFDDLIKDNIIWVLSKLKFRVNCALHEGVEYRLETYPRPKKGVTFFRDYYIIDENGRNMAEGTAYWCLVNFETRKVERTKINFDGIYIDHEPFENGIERFRINEDELIPIGSHKVTRDDLDENEHVNNCRYADMVENVLAGHTVFSIYFSKEARMGDEILLYKEEIDGDTIVAGKLPDGTGVFQAKVR